MDEEPRAHRALIATGDEATASELGAAFAELGITHRIVPSVVHALDEAASGAYGVALIDLVFAGPGVGLVVELAERAPELSVVAFTRVDDSHLGVQVVRAGAA